MAALALILAFMAGEVTAALLAGSLALLSDAAHMLTDAAALGLAVWASRIVELPARGGYTYGFGRVDALAAQINGLALVGLAAWFVVEAARRLVNPPDVAGGVVVITAVIGALVNVAATLAVSRADRSSLNVRGALAHVVTDLWAFLGTAIAGAVVLISGWNQADAIASLLVAGLMVVAGARLLRASGRVFLEAAPTDLDPAVVGRRLSRIEDVHEVHDLHVWDLGGSRLALSAHVLVAPEAPCHEVARVIREILHSEYGIDHATLQVDHEGDQPVAVQLSPRP
jgi:cobalt-zinc-cadmium efflux system protein